MFSKHHSSLTTQTVLCYYPSRQREGFCRVRHRLSLIEPTPLQREADAAGKCVSSSLRNAKAAVKRRPPTCSHRFNYGFGTARRVFLSPKKSLKRGKVICKWVFFIL